MEQVWVGNDLGRIIEQDAVRSVRQLVAETILGREVDELLDELSLWLRFTRLSQDCWLEECSAGSLDLC